MAQEQISPVVKMGKTQEQISTVVQNGDKEDLFAMCQSKAMGTRKTIQRRKHMSPSSKLMHFLLPSGFSLETGTISFIMNVPPQRTQANDGVSARTGDIVAIMS